MWQFFIVTFFDWWEIQFDQVWSSLIHFGRIWSKKIKNKMAIFILFKNVTTFYTNIFWYVQPVRSFFLQKDTQTLGRTDGNTDRRRRSNSSLDIYLAHFSSTTEVSRMVNENVSCWDGCVMTPNNDVFRLTSVTSKCSPKIDFYKLVQLESHLWFINVQGGFEIIELLKTGLLATYFHQK